MDQPFEFIEIDEDSPIAQQLQRDKEEARVRFANSDKAKREWAALMAADCEPLQWTPATSTPAARSVAIVWD